MPVFNVRISRNGSRDWVQQFNAADEGVQGFLTPEEIGRAIVSAPMDFEYRAGYEDGVWKRFASTLVPLVDQAREPQSMGLSLEDTSGKYQYRLIICSDSSVQPEKSKKDDDLVKRKMKLKLVSNIPLKASRQQREQGCLVQFARLCGPQNVNFRLKGIGSSTDFPWMENPCILGWNEGDLSWEAEAEVTFQLGMFAEHGGTLRIGLSSITSKMEDGGVRNVLRAMYTGPGVNWKLQKRMLEEETFSDLVISSSSAKNEKNPKLFKCHRLKLAETSPVFADMLQGNWEEAQTRTIKLPESEDAIEAMLHFIYYGGTDRIYPPREELVLELLQAGHKYNIENLVDVAAFVLQTDNEIEMESPWLSVEGALQTINFARNLEGQRWKELREKCYGIVWVRENGERKQSKSWRKLCGIAKKLGPGFVSLLQNLQPDEDGKYIRKLLPGSLDGVKGLKMEEAEFFYDFLMSSEPAFFTCDNAVGMFMLAEYLGRSVNEVEEKTKVMKQGLDMNWPLKHYRVDYLVELFCLARKKEGEFWRDMKLEAVCKLKEFQTKQPKKIEASLKYKEMIQGNGEVMEELISMGFEEEGDGQPDSKKRRRN